MVIFFAGNNVFGPLFLVKLRPCTANPIPQPAQTLYRARSTPAFSRLNLPLAPARSSSQPDSGRKNSQKFRQNIWRYQKKPYLCSAFEKQSNERSLEGRLAQLVQSICLTSRGSGVRIPQRPPFKRDACYDASLFLCLLVYIYKYSNDPNERIRFDNKYWSFGIWHNKFQINRVIRNILYLNCD